MHESTSPLPSETAWHSLASADVAGRLGTDPAAGLTTAEASRRLGQIGPNSLRQPRSEPWWEEAVEALTEPLILLLIAVAGLYALLGELGDAVTILLVIIAVAGVEVATETRARRAIASLKELSSPTARVVRDGQPTERSSTELVPGDLVLLGPGDRVPADLRLTHAVALRTDESALTGESSPVGKRAEPPQPAESEIGERTTLAFAGTLVTAGKGAGLVVETGRRTALGRVAELTRAMADARTPLQKEMRQLAAWLLWLALALSVAVPVLGVVLAGRPPLEMLLTGLTLAFATIPEELPILITIVLGLGALELARHRAVVRRLAAAETLGSVSVVATDKTGTLTENRMRVARLAIDGEVADLEHATSESARRLLEIGVLANDAEIVGARDGGAIAGDPLDVALLAASRASGLDLDAFRMSAVVLAEYPFDDDRKRMSVVYQRDGVVWVAVKGAAENLLERCQRRLRRGELEPLDASSRADILSSADDLSEAGMRVLGFAERRLGPAFDGVLDVDAVERDLTMVGLAALHDPARPEAAAAVAQLRGAGVHVVMLTGDHPGTAAALAAAIDMDSARVVRGRDMGGLSDDEVATLALGGALFARIAPEHKLRIVRVLQARGEVVAVTGDGVNDGPALREAAIGVAMGRTGTDVAREAADLILADDNLATVVTAVRTGRRLHENLRKAVRYYLAAKVALVASSLGAVLAGLAIPFAPVQIIVLELFMDLGASTTFTAEPPESDVMSRPPRRADERFMDGRMQVGILAGGLSLAAAVLLAYGWAASTGASIPTAQTAAFAAWIVGHLTLAAHMRTDRQSVFRRTLLTSRPFLAWVAAALGLLVLGVAVPPLRERLHLEPLPLQSWAIAVGGGILFPSWWEVAKRLQARRARATHSE